MKQITNAEAALLGLLSEGPKHPYQLEKDVQQRDMRVWTDLSMSSIYKLLRKLERDKLVKSKAEISAGNRTRKTYRLTAAGTKALKAHLRQLFTTLETRKYPLHIALSNLDQLESEETEACLTSYQEELRKSIGGYRDLEAYLVQDGCPRHRQHLALHPIYLLEGELRWVSDYLTEFERSERLS
jgi:DNA-binding PadR family transcriptional regulator